MADARRIHHLEVVGAWILLVVSLLGWPVSMLTWAKDEPATVLGLSWLALTFTAYDILKTSRVHETADKDGEA